MVTPPLLDRRPAARSDHWLYALLPAFPVLLLVMRLWYLSGQDLQTLLLLMQYVSPLGLVTTLLVTLVWIPPAIVLLIRALGALEETSDPAEAARRPTWLVRAARRVPDWVVASAVLLAALTWQMRFLPMLLMLALAITGLTVRQRFPDNPRLVRAACVAAPVAAAVAAYLWLAPAIVQAMVAREPVTAALLLLPPAVAPLLTGPVPARTARPVTHAVAIAALMVAPILAGAILLKAPILPTVAVEVGAAPGAAPVRVVIGHVIVVDNQMTTLLDENGAVQFVLTSQVMSETLCPDDRQIPTIPVSVHDWQVEQTVLTWITPSHATGPVDPRCRGRALVPHR
ncbi:hypothetical protein HC031_27730 [Planosporangium thailandense]|uniref:Uncharacterized protein n=1 Tax=Planosporangium thailandense TaxID=765197 RepID=A0ABX0Y4Z7_9ACTN|nr:hypothetical protein [Planosporangium thailandense]NJC73487.1 hypothetical protein [Planosporangium thailandense]